MRYVNVVIEQKLSVSKSIWNTCLRQFIRELYVNSLVVTIKTFNIQKQE